MTAEEFRAIGIAKFGDGWQSKLARVLGVRSRTVRRWVAGEIEVPTVVQAALGLPATWRVYPDEWVFGSDPDNEREYVIHLVPPRFIARLGDGGAEPGLVLALKDENLFAITWLDPEPAREDLQRLLRAAQTACDRDSMADGPGRQSSGR